MAPLKVLISGGGIAGNALAFWLSKMDYDVTVIERLPSLRVTGLQIDLRGHGIEVLKRMGLEQKYRAKSVQEEGMAVVDGAGKQWAFFPANRSGKGLQGFTTDYEMMRGDFCRLLYDACSKDRVKYVFGTTIDSFTDDGNAVEVRFSDGKTERFDLLVGADGQSSRTRRMLLGPGVPDPFHPLGVYTAYFTYPQPIADGQSYHSTLYIAPGGRLVFTRRNNPHKAQVYLSTVTDSERLKNTKRGDVVEEKRAIAELYRGARWQVDRMVKGMEETDDFYCERLGLVKMAAWSSGRMALLGDAAYCPSATTGMGTTSAIVGAYVLAGEIGEHCGRSEGGGDGLDAALKAYDDRFGPFMDQVQRGLTEGSSAWRKVPTSPWGIAVLNFVMAVAAFVRLDVLANVFLREAARDWTLPDYDDMVREAQKCT